MRASVSALDLVQAVRDRGGHCESGGSVGSLPSRIAALRRDGDVVLVLGAGDIDLAVEGILAGL